MKLKKDQIDGSPFPSSLAPLFWRWATFYTPDLLDRKNRSNSKLKKPCIAKLGSAATCCTGPSKNWIQLSQCLQRAAGFPTTEGRYSCNGSIKTISRACQHLKPISLTDCSTAKRQLVHHCLGVFPHPPLVRNPPAAPGRKLQDYS